MTRLYKLGCRPRRRDPRVPHYSAITAGVLLPEPPAAVHNGAGMPSNLGVMLNDRLGDCTCAGFYHALQLWSFVARKALVTEPDVDVEDLYEQACGYVPGNPSTDQGGVEQDVLGFLLNTGAPMGPDGAQRHKITAFVEVDPAKPIDIRRTIADCGLVYIGFAVPAYMPETAGATWDVDPSGDQTIVGGHCVILVGYDAEGLDVISWGNTYRMTWAFFAKFVDEAYAIADPWWIEATGKTPAGLTLATLEAQMAAIRGVATGLLFAPTGQLDPTAPDPRIAALAQARDAAEQRATAAETRALAAEGQLNAPRLPAQPIPIDPARIRAQQDRDRYREVVESVAQVGAHPEWILNGQLGDVVKRAEVIVQTSAGGTHGNS